MIYAGLPRGQREAREEAGCEAGCEAAKWKQGGRSNGLPIASSSRRNNVIPAKAGAGIHLSVVIPANAGIHLLPTQFLLSSHPEIANMDSRFRGNDESGGLWPE